MHSDDVEIDFLRKMLKQALEEQGALRAEIDRQKGYVEEMAAERDYWKEVARVAARKV